MTLAARSEISTEYGGGVPDALHTEYAFVLPRGYLDGTGKVHRDGVMRLATARDEIIPQRDPRVRENEAYLTVLLLSRVVTRLGSLSQVHTGGVERSPGNAAGGGELGFGQLGWSCCRWRSGRASSPGSRSMRSGQSPARC